MEEMRNRAVLKLFLSFLIFFRENHLLVWVDFSRVSTGTHTYTHLP